MIVFIFFIVFFNVKAYTDTPCEEFFKNPDTLAKAITEKLRLGQRQKALFHLYLKIYFGDPRTNLEGHNFNEVIQVLKKYPELSKLPLREYNLIFEEKNHKAPPSLIDFVRRFKNSASKVRNPLFQIHANLGVWKRMLGFPKPALNPSLSTQKKKELMRKQNEEFLEYLNTFVSQEVLKFLKDPEKDNQEKTLFLYNILNTIREDMLINNKDVSVISQAMLDLVHTSGWGNEHYKELLNSDNPLEQLEGIRKILNQRDTRAMTLGFEGHFAELQRSLGVEFPTGSTKNESLSETLRNLEKDVENMPHSLKQRVIYRVRPLSIQESPFRSCVGSSSDCSSRTYFLKALDPNFLYFTITDQNHRSEGHVTVVLGTAKDKNRREIKIAFVDKIQNVSRDRILPMLESIRLSLKEQGYKLGLPKNVGSHNGLSVEDATRDYVQSEIISKMKTVFKRFKPHNNPYSFENAHSRAYYMPNLLEFELIEDIDVKIEAGEIKQEQRAPEDLNVENLYKEILSLQYSKEEEDQIKFLNNLIGLSFIEELNLSTFQNSQSSYVKENVSNKAFVKNYLEQKIEDSESSLKLRKLAFFTLIEFLQKVLYAGQELISDFLSSYDKFSTEEQNFFLAELSNWKKSNKWRRAVIQKLSIHFLFDTAKMKAALDLNLKTLLNMNVKTNYDSHINITPLMYAVIKENKEWAQLLIDNGADVNAKNFFGKTALIYATIQGNKEIIQLLIDNGADIKAKDTSGQTALMFTQTEEVKQLLIENDADTVDKPTLIYIILKKWYQNLITAL